MGASVGRRVRNVNTSNASESRVSIFQSFSVNGTFTGSTHKKGQKHNINCSVQRQTSIDRMNWLKCNLKLTHVLTTALGPGLGVAHGAAMQAEIEGHRVHPLAIDWPNSRMSARWLARFSRDVKQHNLAVYINFRFGALSSVVVVGLRWIFPFHAIRTKNNSRSQNGKCFCFAFCGWDTHKTDESEMSIYDDSYSSLQFLSRGLNVEFQSETRGSVDIWRVTFPSSSDRRSLTGLASCFSLCVSLFFRSVFFARPVIVCCECNFCFCHPLS